MLPVNNLILPFIPVASVIKQEFFQGDVRTDAVKDEQYIVLFTFLPHNHIPVIVLTV